MIFARRKPPHLWLRIILSFAFFCGGTALVFWANGFRIGRGGIIKTGVFSVSTAAPRSLLLLGEKMIDTTPAIVLGEPVGKKTIHLFHNDKKPLSLDFVLSASRAELFENLVLLPQKLFFRTVGSEDEVRLDPLGRGFWRIFPELNAAAAFDGERWHVFPDLSPEDALADLSGKVEFSSSKSSVFTDPPAPNRQAPKNRGILFFSGSELLFRDLWTSETRRLSEFSAPLSEAFFLPESDSILVFLPTEIYFSPRFNVPFQKILDIEKNSAHFFPKSRTLLFFRKGFWEVFQI